MKLKSINPSSKKDKKFDAVFIDKETKKEKKISFGAKGYRDFTLINKKDSQFYEKEKAKREQVRTNYQTRHAKDLQTEKGKTGLSPGALSYFVLWTAPTLKGGIRNYKKKYGL